MAGGDLRPVEVPAVAASAEMGTSLAAAPVTESAAGPLSRPGRSGIVRGLVRTARPRQWVKNVLVLAAPGAAGVLTHLHPLLLALGAFGIFCLTASGTYLVNDCLDQAVDALHPTKRHRPVASGAVPMPLAAGVGAAMMALGIGLAEALAGWRLATVMGIYVGITVAYSLWLKNEPVIDLASVASGFVLRAIAGGVAVGVVLSNWFLIVASFGSLFMVAGKRHAEHVDLGPSRADHRATLGAYSLAFLRYIRSVASAVAITAYCVWAFEKAAAPHHTALFFELSIVPFVIAVLRYALLLDAGQGGAPEEIVLKERSLQVLGLAWAVLFAMGLYGA